MTICIVNVAHRHFSVRHAWLKPLKSLKSYVALWPGNRGHDPVYLLSRAMTALKITSDLVQRCYFTRKVNSQHLNRTIHLWSCNEQVGCCFCTSEGLLTKAIILLIFKQLRSRSQDTSTKQHRYENITVRTCSHDTGRGTVSLRFHAFSYRYRLNARPNRNNFVTVSFRTGIVWTGSVIAQCYTYFCGGETLDILLIMYCAELGRRWNYSGSTNYFLWSEWKILLW